MSHQFKWSACCRQFALQLELLSELMLKENESTDQNRKFNTSGVQLYIKHLDSRPIKIWSKQTDWEKLTGKSIPEHEIWLCLWQKSEWIASPLQSPQSLLSSWGGGQRKNSRGEGVPGSKTECSWMNARKRRGEKNGSEEKGRGGRLAGKDWQLVSIAWPRRVRPPSILDSLKDGRWKKKRENELEC